MEKYLNMKPKPREKISTITWTPRWSYDIKHGGSNFIEYKDKFLDLCKKMPHDMKFIFRPHPLMFDELIKKNIISPEEKDSYIRELNSLNIKMDFENPIDFVLEETDLLITDLSSIITEFFLTNKPIIYCKKNIEFNKSSKEFEKYMYVTTSWEEVEYYIFEVLAERDILKAPRREFIDREFKEVENSAKKIVDRIISDYNKK